MVEFWSTDVKVKPERGRLNIVALTYFFSSYYLNHFETVQCIHYWTTAAIMIKVLKKNNYIIFKIFESDVRISQKCGRKIYMFSFLRGKKPNA